MSKAKIVVMMPKTVAAAVTEGATWVAYKNNGTDNVAVAAFTSRNAGRDAKVGTVANVKAVSLALMSPAHSKPTTTNIVPDHLRKSTIESPCFIVWDTAEKMLAKDPATRRKANQEKCIAKGVAFYTARTQYQLFTQARKADAAATGK